MEEEASQKPTSIGFPCKQSVVPFSGLWLVDGAGEEDDEEEGEDGDEDDDGEGVRFERTSQFLGVYVWVFNHQRNVQCLPMYRLSLLGFLIFFLSLFS